MSSSKEFVFDGDVFVRLRQNARIVVIGREGEKIVEITAGGKIILYTI